MRKLSFRLITIATLGLLLFSLYLNFIYKGGDSEFTPARKNSFDSSATTKPTGQMEGKDRIAILSNQ